MGYVPCAPLTQSAGKLGKFGVAGAQGMRFVAEGAGYDGKRKRGPGVKIPSVPT